jgi:hypothetical protein
VAGEPHLAGDAVLIFLEQFVAESFGDMRSGFAFEPKALSALASGAVPEDVRDGFIAKAEAMAS